MTDQDSDNGKKLDKQFITIKMSDGRKFSFECEQFVILVDTGGDFQRHLYAQPPFLAFASAYLSKKAENRMSEVLASE